VQIGDIKEIKNRAPVLSMDAMRPLDAAIQEMCLNNRGSIAVTEEGRLAGIVTERDLLLKILGTHRDTESLRVGDVMTRDVEVARLDDELADGLKKMKDGHFRHLPVVDHKGRLVAMVTQSDFIASNANESRSTKETLAEQAYAKFQPWLLTVGIATYFIITTAAVFVYFGL
jgi:CBS domain-containing protein